MTEPLRLSMATLAAGCLALVACAAQPSPPAMPTGPTDAGARVTDTVSLAAIEGTEWRLHAIDNEPLRAGVNPPTLRVEGGRVAGFSGCNRYMGGVTESAPGVVKFTQLASTMMACEGEAMQLEQRYLRLVGGATQYSLDASRLALVARDGERSVTLQFDRVKAP